MIVKITFQLVATIIAFIPTYLFLAMRAILNPASEGFWAEVVVFGLGVYFFGGLQLIAIIILIWFSVSAIWD